MVLPGRLFRQKDMTMDQIATVGDWVVTFAEDQNLHEQIFRHELVLK